MAAMIDMAAAIDALEIAVMERKRARQHSDHELVDEQCRRHRRPGRQASWTKSARCVASTAPLLSPWPWVCAHAIAALRTL
jgi:hypothetical protein